jgi:peptide deformylase
MIITNNEAALRVKCEDVLPEEVGSLIATLEAELSYANRLGKGGIGLAAPQIGIYKKIAILRLNSIKINLVNCEIKNSYDKIIFNDEGCLSFPALIINTNRYREIHVINNLVEPYAFIATDLAAIAVQHELDHLNSVLFMDHKVAKLVPIVNTKKVGPNDPCLCGSNKKYKKCCKI